MRLAVRILLFRLRWGPHRPCGDGECVADFPQRHGIYYLEEWYR